MKNSDAEPIRRTLDGDDTAFTQLVRKYQKPVHALAWRKNPRFRIGIWRDQTLGYRNGTGHCYIGRTYRYHLFCRLLT